MKTIKLELNVDEINLILEALGTMPFNRVYELIGRIQEDARSQLQSNQDSDQVEPES